MAAVGAIVGSCYPRIGHAMPSLTQLIDAWGYVAIALVVILGNLGLPVPEETVLTIGGYLAWRGELGLRAVVIVALVSAVAGDNIGYWLGRRYGQPIVHHLLTSAPGRVDRVRRFVLRHGVLAVFVARFVAGLRFMAGPIAGSTGLEPARFFLANLLGAVVYVPAMVSAGYAVGYGLGDRIERLRHAAGEAERIVVITLALAAGAAWVVRIRRHHRRS